MKKLLITAAIVGIVAASSNQSNAQVSLNVNIGSQPAWVPVGYQNIDYYYMPEVQSYYYVSQRQFVYLSGNRLVRSKNLPNHYRGYNLNNSRKIVVYGNSPYRNYNTHRVQYANHSNYVRSSYGGGHDRYSQRGYYKPTKVKYREHDNYRGNDHNNKGHNRDRD